MHVAHFEARALARQATRTERRDAALVGDFGQRIVLVHELRLSCDEPKNSLIAARDRLRVDEVLRRQAFGLGERQALAHRALDAHEADAEDVLGHFADRTHATVAEMIDVIDRAATVADLDQHLEHVEDVRGLAELLDERLRVVVVARAEVLVSRTARRHP